jgi:XRE family transcriptional regulator of biofilm formation
LPFFLDLLLNSHYFVFFIERIVLYNRIKLNEQENIMVQNRIKQLRLLKGYSINALSEKTGVSKSYLSYIERGIQKNPSLQILSKLANSLGTTVEDLLEEDHYNNEKEKKNMDEDWIQLFTEATKHGVTKEDFSLYLDFIKFQKINKKN